MMVGKKYENITGTYNDRGKTKNSSSASYDKNAAAKLWYESAEMVGLRSDETILKIQN